METPDQGGQNLLHDVFGVVGVSTKIATEAVDWTGDALEQRAQRPWVPAASRDD